MVFYLLVLMTVMFAGAKFCMPGEFNIEYMDKKNTTAVNGIFVILVLFSHYIQYADFGGVYDIPYLVLREHLKQLVVAMFMFYSGYGMMEAIRGKGGTYVRRIFSKFWQLLLRVDIAVLLFLAVDAILGIKYPLGQTLLAFTTWTSVGNSNWYITAILIIYIIMYISFRICLSGGNDPGRRYLGIVLTFVLIGGAVFAQIAIGRPSYCYNTMLLLPFGCLYSEARPVIERIVKRSDITYLLTMTISAGIYMVAFFHRETWGITGYTLWGIAFISIVVLVTMKLSIHNGFLEWCGRHIFGIYMLQRLPMIVFDHLGYIETHKYMSLLAVIVITFLLAALFQKYTGRLIDAIRAS